MSRPPLGLHTKLSPDFIPSIFARKDDGQQPVPQSKQEQKLEKTPKTDKNKAVEFSTRESQETARLKVIKELFDEDWECKQVDGNDSQPLDWSPGQDIDNGVAGAAFDDMDGKMSEFQEDLLVKDAFEKGIDFRDYSESLNKDLDVLEGELVQEYVKSSKKFTDLYSQIKSCDIFLERMEEMLSGFQTDLSNVSGEIKSLQDQSTQLNVKLKNRRIVQDRLSAVLDGIVIAPDVIRKVFEADVNELFLLTVIDLSGKMSYVKSNRDKHIKAFKDVGPELERLRNKAAERIRDFFLEKFKALRLANTNVQIIQMSVLIKYKELIQFVLTWHPEVALELRQNYILTISKYYLSLFERYAKGAQKLQLPASDKNNLMGAEEAAKKTSFLPTKTSLKDRAIIYTLGTRADILTDVDASVIITHVAEENNQKFPFEALFRSLTRTVVDSATAEYAFCTEFFHNTKRKLGSNHAIAVAVFEQSFEATLKLCLQTLTTYTTNSVDALGVLLCLRVTHLHEQLLKQRTVVVLDAFLGQINTILWQCYHSILEMHADSLRRAVIPKLLIPKETHPHYVTRRYAEFAASVLSLNENFDNPQIPSSLIQLRTEVEALLMRMSQEFPDRKQQLVFLINNHDLVLNVLQESPYHSMDAERNHWDKLLNHKILDFVDEISQPYFGNLMTFVTDTEQQSNLQDVAAERFEAISDDFSSNWRQSLSSVNASVVQTFPNFRNGTAVLQAILSQVAVYWSRYHVLLDKRFKKGVPFRNQPVGVQNVMVEMKKFKGSF